MCLRNGILAIFVISCVDAMLWESPMPDRLYNCYETRSKVLNITNNVGHAIQSNCINKYLWYTASDRFFYNITKEQISWIKSLEREYNAAQQSRNKRSIRHLPVRREIRSMTYAQRRAFFNAVNALKTDTSILPNLYDTLATYHQGIAIESGHDGANFLGWHRVYLLYFELALQRKDPSVTIPYWDSTLDYELEYPTTSILFSSLFFGNGDGIVVTGPFANWITPDGTNLIRNIGSTGSLITQEGVDFIIRNPNIIWHAQVLDSENESFPTTIEGQHNNVHNWVGGHMVGLETAAQDPMFYMHHAFVDYMWERFRQKQIAAGINPETDYVNVGGPLHAPNRPMDGFPWVTNVQGYSNIFTRHFYRYEAAPACPHCNGSPFLYCNPYMNKCVSFTTWDVNEQPRGHGQNRVMTDSLRAAFLQSPLQISKKFRVSSVDSRTRGKQVPTILDNINAMNSQARASASSRATSSSAVSSGFFSPRLSPLNPLTKYIRFQHPTSVVQPAQSHMFTANARPALAPNEQNMFQVLDQKRNIHQFKQPNLFNPSIQRSIQNSFSLDGVADMTRWAYIPIRIVHVRASGTSFPTKSIINGQPISRHDPYSTSLYDCLKPYINPGTPATYAKCASVGSGANKVFVQSDGLSYKGRYIDYAVVDERQPISEEYTYVALKNPDLGTSKAYLSAYDSYGRVCVPRCLIPKSNPPSYHACSGVINISTQIPRMYGNTYGEAILGKWNFADRSCPKSYNGEVFMTFICDFTDNWPWKNCRGKNV